MITAIRTRLMTFFSSVRTGSVFITDSEDCPCFKVAQVAKNSKHTKSFYIKNTDSNETLDQIAKINTFKNLLIFAHGDSKKMQFFYFQFQNNFERKIYIQDNWWTVFAKDKRNLYIHACNGANILTRNATIKRIFGSWVSYSDIVYGFDSSNQKITSINQKFIDRVSKEVAQKRSSAALKTAIISAYFEIKADLEDLKNSDDPETNCNAAFIRAIIACVGKNINTIEHH